MDVEHQADTGQLVAVEAYRPLRVFHPRIGTARNAQDAFDLPGRGIPLLHDVDRSAECHSSHILGRRRLLADRLAHDRNSASMIYRHNISQL
ncbi:hypothetical protein D3C80_1914770 [compost metagenome]